MKYSFVFCNECILSIGLPDFPLRGICLDTETFSVEILQRIVREGQERAKTEANRAIKPL